MMEEKYSNITVEEVRKWVDELCKSDTEFKKTIEDQQKIGYVGGGCYYMGNGLYGGLEAWKQFNEVLQKYLQEPYKRK